MQEVPRPSLDEYGKDPSSSRDISSRFTLGHSQASVRHPREPQPLRRWTIKTGCVFCIANRTGRRTARFESDLLHLILGLLCLSGCLTTYMCLHIISPPFSSHVTLFSRVIYSFWITEMTRKMALIPELDFVIWFLLRKRDRPPSNCEKYADKWRTSLKLSAFSFTITMKDGVLMHRCNFLSFPQIIGKSEFYK